MLTVIVFGLSICFRMLRLKKSMLTTVQLMNYYHLSMEEKEVLSGIAYTIFCLLDFCIHFHLLQLYFDDISAAS